MEILRPIEKGMAQYLKMPFMWGIETVGIYQFPDCAATIKAWLKVERAKDTVTRELRRIGRFVGIESLNVCF